MRLSQLLEYVTLIRRAYVAHVESYTLNRGDTTARSVALSDAIAKIEEFADQADRSRDPLASHIFQTRAQLKKIVDDPRKGNVRIVRDLVERSYFEAGKLGYKDEFYAWKRLLGAGICGAM